MSIFMAAERETAEALVPGLDTALSEASLKALEARGGPGFEMFRVAGGPGLVLPEKHGGRGSSLEQAVAVQRVIGSRAPSLAVATMMHHFSVVTLADFVLQSAPDDRSTRLLQGIARDRLLVASAFAEGASGRSILDTNIEAVPEDGGYRISGSKKPCSLSGSMNLLVASVKVPSEGGGTVHGVALIPPGSEGLEVRPFWASDVLAGAESDEILLNDVRVHANRFVPLYEANDPTSGDRGGLVALGVIWFTLLAVGGYVGMTSALVEQVLAKEKGTPADRLRLVTDLESAMAGAYGVARSVTDHDQNETFARALVVRFAAQEAIARATHGAVELLGGISFMRSNDAAYLAAASHGLSLHPPSRSRISRALVHHFREGSFSVADI